MRVYIAGSFGSRERLLEMAKGLYKQSSSVVVVSRWLGIKPPYPSPLMSAVRDIEDLNRAEMFILDRLEPSTRGGAYVELGYALAKKLLIVLIGPRTNVFTHLASQYPTWEDFFQSLGHEGSEKTAPSHRHPDPSPYPGREERERRMDQIIEENAQENLAWKRWKEFLEGYRQRETGGQRLEGSGDLSEEEYRSRRTYDAAPPS